jgi:hypothetical protein
MTQVVEHLPSKCKALSSNPSITVCVVLYPVSHLQDFPYALPSNGISDMSAILTGGIPP